LSSNTPASSSFAMRYGAPLSFDAARRVVEAAEQEARRNQWSVTIAVVDSAAQLVILHKLDQALYASVDVAQAKARTALNFRRPTKMLEDALAAGGQGLRFLSVNGLAALEGGLPLVIGGEVVGAIGVSGMQSGQDAQVAEAGAREAARTVA
jgi:glc operon protein GlcG